MTSLYDQSDFQVRLDWGPVGAREMAADISVVVDVLSFSTSVTIAAERGMTVIPYWWKGPRAAEFAQSMDAVLAVGRLEATKLEGAPPSLSPAGLLTCDPVPRLVLPSPNGSTICVTLQDGGAEVLIGSLRNSAAVAALLEPSLLQGLSVALVAAGERWDGDDSLRPALEDQLGVGAIAWHLRNRTLLDRASPETIAAADLFEAARPELPQRLRSCVGGRELTAKGFGADIDVAAQLDVSTTVPMLVEGALISSTRLG